MKNEYRVFYDEKTLKVTECELIFSENTETISEGNHFITLEFPEYQEQTSKYGVLYCKPESKELYYKYFDNPKTVEELGIEKLNRELNDLRLVVAEFIGGEK